MNDGRRQFISAGRRSPLIENAFRIGLLVERQRAYGRSFCEGAAAYAQERSDISLGMLEWSDLYVGRKTEGYDAFVVRVLDDRMDKALRRTGKPVVDVFFGKDREGFAVVDLDNEAIARLAAEHFHERGFRSFAYCGYNGVRFSDNRRDAFVRHVAAAYAVRAVDPHTPIVIESNGMDSPANFPFLRPLALKDVIYQVHMYDPGAYTHQGVHARSAAEWKPASYPDRTKGWDKTYLKRMLKPVRDFQQRHGAVIYVGEFSAIAWAPNADGYLRDCISIFREYGWHWTYHAFREWNGWSVEHRAVDWKRMLPDDDTPRKRVLVDGLRN